MRAGPYAEYRGRVYRSVSLDKPRVRLLVPGSEPCPEGFERTAQGQWTLLVPRQAVTRLFHVATTAVWGGKRVDVLSVDSGVAHFSYFGMDLPVASTVNRTQSDEWDGFVPVEELTEAIEVVTDVPV